MKGSSCFVIILREVEMCEQTTPSAIKAAANLYLTL